MKSEIYQMHFNKKQMLRLIPALLWMGVIFWFSAKTGTDSAAESMPIAELLHLPDWVVRKGAHMTEYAVLAVLFLYFFSGSLCKWRKSAGWAWSLSVCYAATDEFHQLFSDGRSGQLKDVCIDAAGALAGLLLLTIIHKFKTKNSPEGSGETRRQL